MSKTLELTINRHMSTPARVVLVPEHLPPHVRDDLTRLQQAIGRRQNAETAFADAVPADKGQAQAAADTAAAEVHTALYELATTTAGSTTALRDSGVGAFVMAMERVAAGVREALDALDDAQLAADLVASAHPGKQCLRIDTKSAAGAPIRQQFSMRRSDLKAVLASLPDGLD